ncbi:peptidylprolyl isomerase, partial [Gammaproteobacteria bacterium]|nr:peptidylprolyl isomerase [Gammaproteobacteria bacterium]
QINSMLKSIEQRFAEQGAALPPAESMLEQVRERLIIEELQLQMAIRGGVRVGDGELNQAFEEIAKNNEMTLEAFIESLESEGASYEELRDQVRKEMIIQRVQRGKVGRQVNITEQELDGFLATEGSVKELSPELFIRQILVEDKIKAEKVLSDLESGEDFQVLAKERSTNANAASGGEMGWRNLADLPSLFADALKGKKKGYVSPPLESGSGFFVLQLEDKRGNLVRFEEQWNARHILMMPTKLRDETFTKSELEAVRDRAMAGEDFALLAKEFSEDPGSASRGGDLEWLSLGKTAPAFEKMMITSPLQEISPVFESEFGFHFLQVLGQRTEDLTEEVIKDRAYGIIFARKYDEELENSLRTMRAEAFVEFKELD